MIKRIKSSVLKIEKNGACCIVDKNGKSYYDFCASDKPSNTRVDNKIDWLYYGIISYIIAGILFTCYCLFIKS